MAKNNNSVPHRGSGNLSGGISARKGKKEKRKRSELKMKCFAVWGRNGKFLKIRILLCALLLSFIAQNFKMVNQESAIQLVSAQELSVPPDFSLMEVNSGRVIRLYDYSNKVILLNFMTTWCPWDAKEFDYVLVPLYENYYKNDASVVFLTIHLDPHAAPDIQSYAREHNINWPILEGGKWSDSKVAKDYGVNAVPTTFILKCFNSTRKVVYYKRGYDPESINKFRQAIESAKQEIHTVNNKMETPNQAANLFFHQYVIQFTNGNTFKINLSTTSEIIEDLTFDSNNSRLSLRVNERYESPSHEMGLLAIHIPKEFLEARQSSIHKLEIVLDGNEFTPYLKMEEGEYLLKIEYGYGIHEIDIYYRTYSLRVYVQSIFGMPISGVSVVLEWPNGKPFKTLTTSTSGTATFIKVPSLSSPYTLYVKHGPLSFQYPPQQLQINQDTETTFTTYIHYDTFIVLTFMLIIGITSWKIQKHRKKSEEENETQHSMKHSGAKTNV
ncbi:MAG: redoxin domain-containing protein [Candidatus Bathycorpusculaceae bacterium]